MKHLMGSKYFFSKYPGFHSHDTDTIEIIETNEFLEKRVIRGQGQDMFQLRKKPKEILIRDALRSQLPMVVGKFLIPEFNAEIGFTIEDLPLMQPLIDKIDEKHNYERIIYEAYLENGKFELTKEQRDRAYAEYKKYRN
jgi:hypothetical protein